MKIKGKTRKERSDFQLKEWVKGNSIHNDIDDECCPDFSCCDSKLLASENERKLFKSLKERSKIEDEKGKQCYETMMGMLMGFLGNMIASCNLDKKVYITDGNISHKKDMN